MRASFPGAILVAGMIGTLCLALTGCRGDALQGTYRHTAGGTIALDFKRGRVTMTSAGEAKTYDYRVDGNKITIINPKEGNLELTLLVTKRRH